MEKKLLLGDEAIALGAIHAGIRGVYAYPGTPSTEITEYIQRHPLARARGLHSTWCTNEKTAVEAALGASYAGARVIACMKHVGLNVAADAFVNAAITGVNGGMIVVVADDPSMHSSQNEQDSRFYGKFSMITTLEPSTQQEAYDMMQYGFELSEREKLPVLMRIVMRLAHSRAAVTVKEEAEEVRALPCAKDPASWVLLPANSRRKYAALVEQQPRLEQAAAEAPYTRYEQASGEKPVGILACGIGYNYVTEVREAAEKFNILKITQYPLPADLVRRLAADSREILVVEDGQPFAEELVRGMLSADYPVRGRLTDDLPRTGELTPDSVAAAMGHRPERYFEAPKNVVGRPPALCQGCGHRDVYTALNEVVKEYPDARVFADIGCYTLGALPPFRAIDTCLDMGASITMAKGAADAGVFPAIAVIGDSTFTHSGMTGLLDAVNDKAQITVIISDNLTTAMTGGQDSAGTNKFEAICLGLGVEPEHVRVVVPLPKNMEEITRILREEIEYKGVSVIIPRRECIQTLKQDIILSGVGGQGILSIATIIGEAATQAGLTLKQAEVHGMSQRGGDVQSNLRLSDGEIASDLIAVGTADMILSLEPMEALRYIPYLNKEGWVITSSSPFKNIPNYPEDEALMAELRALPHVVMVDVDALAKEHSMPKCANVMLLGAAARYLNILSVEELRESIARVFGTKGEAVVEMNRRAFDLGHAASDLK